MSEKQFRTLLVVLLVAACAVALVLCIIVQHLAKRVRVGSSKQSVWERVFLSNVFIGKSEAGKIAYVGVMVAFCIVSNVFEIKFATTQFSLTIFTSVLAGIVIGPLYGALAVFLGDGIGYLINSMGYPYYWWVAVSCAMMAFIAGLIIKLPMKFKGSGYLKLALICIATLAFCSVGINSTGMYYLGLSIYMPKDVLEAAASRFGGELTYGVYLIIRFFILGQIWNSLVNYALLFAAVPLLNAAKPLKINIR